MDGSTAVGRVHDKAKSSDGSSLADLGLTPDLLDKYREYLSIGSRDSLSEAANEPVSESATGMLISISRPVASTRGNEAVLHIRSGGLSNQPTSAPTAKVSEEENTDPADNPAEATRATSSLAPGASTTTTASTSVQTDSLPGMSKHHHTSDRQRSPEISPKDSLSQNTELPSMVLDPLAREPQNRTDILGTEQFEKSLLNAPAGVPASLPST